MSFVKIEKIKVSNVCRECKKEYYPEDTTTKCKSYCSRECCVKAWYSIVIDAEEPPECPCY